MRCQFHGDNEIVAATCLCPNASSTEPAKMCSYADLDGNGRGEQNYSDPIYCRKLNVITYRPRGSSCHEHGECNEGLYCESGTCEACLVSQTCPDKSFSHELSN